MGSGTAGAFKYLRLKPWLTTSNMYDIVISDFTNDRYFYLDGTTSYPRDRVRYAVVVYKTDTSGHQMTLGMSTNRTGSKTIRDYNGNAATGLNGHYVNYDMSASMKLDVSSSWNYFVLDMKSGTNATVWDDITTVYQITLGTNVTNSGQTLDLSHIAYFSTEGEAKRFGEAAKAFSNNPGEYLADKGLGWNMGNNTAFTMLYASSGGGWQNTYTGGTNNWSNGYYSYQIGKHTGTGSSATGVNGYRSTAKSMGYPVPDGSIGYGWRPMDTILSSTEQYYTVDYLDCPYMLDQNGVKVYQVALFVRSGMVSFTNVKFIGLDLQSHPIGEAADLKLYNGILYVEDENSKQESEVVNTKILLTNNLLSISYQMNATQTIEEVEQNIVLKYPALSFEDEIYYNVFFTTQGMEEKPVEMGLLMFDTLEEDGTIFDASAVIPGVSTIDGLYVARSLGVQGKDLGKTLYFRVYAQMPNGSYVYSKAASYSARQYAKAVLAGNYSVETKALIAAMLKYGEAARGYFGGVQTLEDLITEDVDTLVSDYSSSLLDTAGKPDASKAGNFAATATGFTKKAPAVSFEGAFAINYFFTPSTTVQGDMTLYYWNAEDYEAADVLSIDNATGSMAMTPGKQYSAAITGISAKDMDTTYYVAVVYHSNGQTYCSGVLAYSLATYCQSKAAATDSISSLAQATAVYGYHAKKLFG